MWGQGPRRHVICDTSHSLHALGTTHSALPRRARTHARTRGRRADAPSRACLFPAHCHCQARPTVCPMCVSILQTPIRDRGLWPLLFRTRVRIYVRYARAFGCLYARTVVGLGVVAPRRRPRRGVPRRRTGCPTTAWRARLAVAACM